MHLFQVKTDMNVFWGLKSHVKVSEKMWTVKKSEISTVLKIKIQQCYPHIIQMCVFFTHSGCGAPVFVSSVKTKNIKMTNTASPTQKPITIESDKTKPAFRTQSHTHTHLCLNSKWMILTSVCFQSLKGHGLLIIIILIMPFVIAAGLTPVWIFTHVFHKCVSRVRTHDDEWADHAKRSVKQRLQ